MKVIDFEKKGNVVRFYLGHDDCEDYSGDDWNDRPYEANAGMVYDEFVAGQIDISFPFDFTVYEPQETVDYSSGDWCKDDMKERHVPCIVIIPSEHDRREEFYHALADARTFKIYFGDDIAEIKNKLQELDKSITILGENYECE